MYSLRYLMPKEVDESPQIRRRYPIPTFLPDDFSDDENELIAPLPSVSSHQQLAEWRHSQRSSGSSSSTRSDDASLALALRLQDEEERRLEQAREQDDLAYARSLQQRFEHEEQEEQSDENNSKDDNDEESEPFSYLELSATAAETPYALSPARMQKTKKIIKKKTRYAAASMENNNKSLLTTTTFHLAECQLKALTFVQQKARHMHQATLPELQQRVEVLGYSATDLTQCLDYIRDDAPIIIHLKEPTLELLAQDTHYRNLFETGASGGKKCTRTRQRWEAALFGNSYSKHCDGALRPKYACLNITGDVQGCYPARHYGDLYITLCKHVRSRVTMSDDDTGRNHQDALATCDAYAHVLARYNDMDLRAVLDVASTRARRIRGAPSRSTTYKECQIHGPVNLRTDVEALSIPASHRDAPVDLHRTVQAFQQLTGCNVMWQKDLFE